jgi:hypothetical protein
MAQPISPDEHLESGLRLDTSSFPKSSPLSPLGVLGRWYYVSVPRLLAIGQLSRHSREQQHSD